MIPTIIQDIQSPDDEVQIMGLKLLYLMPFHGILEILKAVEKEILTLIIC